MQYVNCSDNITIRGGDKNAMLNDHQKMLLAIVQNALWSKTIELENYDWESIACLAKQQGVLWMLYPGLKNKKECVPEKLLKEWRSVMHSGLMYNEQLTTFQEELFAWLEKNSIRAVVLKGTSCSRYYPYPSLRPLGDIDILIDHENMALVAEYLISAGFHASETQHGFHIGYYRGEIIVEVHYRCSELPENEGTQAAILEEKRFLDCREIAKYDELAFPILSASHQALMLLMHMERHMQEDGIGLRQLCDWAVFVYGSDSRHWHETIPLLKSCGLFIYAEVITMSCVKYLGLAASYAPWIKTVDEKTVEAFVEDIFRGGNLGVANEHHVGSLFTDRRLMGTQEHGILKGMLTKMKSLAFRKWPITQKYAFLLPICYLYIPIEYVIMSFVNPKSRRNVITAIHLSRRRRKLYYALHLFEP